MEHRVMTFPMMGNSFYGHCECGWQLKASIEEKNKIEKETIWHSMRPGEPLLFEWPDGSIEF